VSATLTAQPKAYTTAFTVLGAASLCHFLNDLMQSVFVATYPIFKGGFHLSFGQIGLLTLTYQITASLLQPMIGLYTDRKPLPYSLPFGMGSSLAGLLTLAYAQHYAMLLVGGMLLGVGSSVFHPETSRLARLASGGAHGLAQSVFQVGGNVGSALGPLMVALLVVPHGQVSLAWFALAALFGMLVLTGLGRWYTQHGRARARGKGHAIVSTGLSSRQVGGAMAVLTLLLMSKYFYLASFGSYYVFYLMQHFGLTTRTAQLCLFVFLAAVALGTVVGGPVGDRIGRKKVIWGSILGVLPFTLALPYASLPLTLGLSVVIGLVLASAFSAIVVYAQELMPGRVGMVSGLCFGLSFGLGGIGAAVLGQLADWTNIDFVYKVCSFLPLMGLLTALLPDVEKLTRSAVARQALESKAA
jgi:MFS transporter, FSR family, fosmidomycin resistance protein